MTIANFDMKRALQSIRRHCTRVHYRNIGLKSFFLFCSILTMSACTPDCPNKASDLGPLVTAFDFKRQFPSDPYTAVFGFQFQSQNNGMAGGTAEFYVGDSQTPVKVKMSELMSASGLNKASRAGEVGAALRFSRDNLSDGQLVDMRLQLLDDTGQRSNCARVSLLFKFP